MAVQLPTDTQHLQLEARQYELFNRPLGQGVPRRKLYIGAAAVLVWCPLMLLVGVTPLSTLGPFLFIVPPFAAVFLGTRLGDDGRMTLMRWYDAILTRTPSRRRPIRNPLQPTGVDADDRVVIAGRVTEVHPGTGNVAPLVGRKATKASTQKVQHR
jgi:hypothetical protein